MQQFMPFEDEWDALDKLPPEALVPYRVGVPCTHGLADRQSVPQCTPEMSPMMVISSPT